MMGRLLHGLVCCAAVLLLGGEIGLIAIFLLAPHLRGR